MTYVSQKIEEIGPWRILGAFGVGSFKRFFYLPGDLFAPDEAADIIHGLGLEIAPDELSGVYITVKNSDGAKYTLQRVDGGYQMTCVERASTGAMVPAKA
jgi:hypothetical protein